MRSSRMFFGAALLAVSAYMMAAAAQSATSDQVGPLVYACTWTKNCYTKNNDCSQGGRFMTCVCDTKKDTCYINNQGGN